MKRIQGWIDRTNKEDPIFPPFNGICWTVWLDIACLSRDLEGNYYARFDILEHEDVEEINKYIADGCKVEARATREKPSRVELKITPKRKVLK